MPDGKPVAGRDVPVGGQAVLEGVMMRGVSTWSVAVRRPDGEIEVSSEPLVSWAKRHRVLRWPVVRGVIALGESLKIGFRAMQLAANAQLPADGDQRDVSRGAWAVAVAGALVIAIGLFFVVPVAATSLIKDELSSPFLFWLAEGVLRIAILIGYIAAISRLAELRRVFEYHGAEHQTISCYEAGDELTPARAAAYSRYHPRCGTSFLLIVMVLAIFVFAPIGLPEWYWLVASRVLGIPLIAGLSYEVDQVGWPQPGERLGAGPDVAGAQAAGTDDPRARRRAAHRCDRGPRVGARGREPRGRGSPRGLDRGRGLWRTAAEIKRPR